MVLCVLLWIVTVYVSETTVGGFFNTNTIQVDPGRPSAEGAGVSLTLRV